MRLKWLILRLSAGLSSLGLSYLATYKTKLTSVKQMTHNGFLSSIQSLNQTIEVIDLSVVITYTTGNTSNFDFIDQKYFDVAYDTWNDISYAIGASETAKTSAFVPLKAYD